MDVIRKILPFLCCFFGSGFGTLLPNNSDISLEQDFANCILNISQTYLDTSLPVAIQTPGTWEPHFKLREQYGDMFLKTLTTRSNMSQFILSYATNFETSVKFGSFIIFPPAVQSEKFTELLGSMIKRISVELANEKFKGIIVIMDHFDSDEFIGMFLRFIFSSALRFSLVNVIAMMPQVSLVTNTVRNIDIFSWIPSEQDRICSKKVDDIIHIDTWMSEESRFVYGSNLFPTQSTTNLRGCKVNLIHYPNYPLVYDNGHGLGGVGFQFLELLCKRFNCMITWDNSLNDDIRFPVTFGSQARLHRGYLSYPYFRLCYSWFVPAGPERPRWQSLVRVFTPLMWTCAMVVCILGSCTFWLIQKSRITSSNGDIRHAVITALLTHLGAGDTNNYRGPVAVTFFSAWLLYCIVINTAYQAGLFGLIVYPGQFPTIKTLEQLEKSGLIKKSAIQMYNSDDYWQKMNEYEKCTKPYSTLCLEDAVEYGVSAYLHEQEYGKLYASLHKDEWGKERIVSLEEVFSIGHQGFFISNFFHILHTTPDTLLHRATSGGLIDEWARDEILRFNIRNSPIEVDAVFALSLLHLQSAFYLLLVGLMLSLFVFMIELSMHWFHRWMVKFNLLSNRHMNIRQESIDNNSTV